MSDPPFAGGLVPGGFAIWTGQEVIFGPVASASARDRQTTDASLDLLAYAPANDAWRRITLDPAAAEVLGDATQDIFEAAALVGDEILIGRTGGGTGDGRETGRLVALDPSTGRSRPLDPGPFDASPYPDLSGEVLVTPERLDPHAMTAAAGSTRPDGRAGWIYQSWPVKPPMT